MRLGLGSAERFLGLFAAHLGPPIWYRSVGTHMGFRYTAPDARHFCLLKGVRAVSGMNACINLAIGGYTQEIGVIIRTIVECTSLIDWVKLEASPDGSLRSDPQRTYVKTYFEDYRRDRTGESLNLAVRQKDIHQDVGAWLDEGAERVGVESSSTARLMSNIYLANSSYVHARYPEVMDLFGGLPGVFHLHGMRGTPKDTENAEIIATYATTVDQAIAGIARHFAPPFLEGDAMFNAWISGL